MNIRLEGSERLRSKLAAAAQVGSLALTGALYEEAEAIMTDSKQNYVPVDTGALRASGFVELPAGNSVTFGYGGPAAPYAVIVHEDLTKHHPIGSAKYLELPIMARLAGMPSLLATKARLAIQGAMQKLGKAERRALG